MLTRVGFEAGRPAHSNRYSRQVAKVREGASGRASCVSQNLSKSRQYLPYSTDSGCSTGSLFLCLAVLLSVRGLYCAP